MALYLDTTVQTAKVSLRVPRISQRGRIVSYFMSCLANWTRQPPPLVKPTNQKSPIDNYQRFDNQRSKNKN
jgi:hypothetical protein